METLKQTFANKNFRIIGILLGLIIYHFLFWKQLFGLNLLVFTILFFVSIKLFNRKTFASKQVNLTGFLTVLLSIIVIINGSLVSKIIYSISFFIWIGFVFFPNIKSIIVALPNGFYHFILSIEALINSTKDIQLFPSKYNNKIRNAKLILIPLLILIVFFVIFVNANPVFNLMMSKILDQFADFFINLFENFSFYWIYFMVLGFVIISGIYYKGGFSSLTSFDENGVENLKRTKLFVKKNFNPIGLKDEFKTGIYVFILVNILLAIVNYIDINWIWLNFKLPKGMNYSQLVHEGTYLLILSILLSMAIILYFFRKNQNFYPQNRILKISAFVWIIQNIILVISVAIRNYRYINEYGLAYKRIGVIFFLILTLIGLITLIFKIQKIKTSYFLLKTNSWATYFVIILLAVFNWDLIIADYNLNRKSSNEIDKEFLISLSNKTLPIIYYNVDKINKQNKILKFTYTYTEGQILYSTLMNYKIKEFKKEYEKRSILSWNYSDYMAYKKLKIVE